MAQPEWRLVANLGDASPIDYGGYFVYVDDTGVYTPEAELLESPEDDEGEWVVYRFTLDRCTFINGILSDNPYHPKRPAWWADSVASMAACAGTDEKKLIRLFCSSDPIELAEAYRHICYWHGPQNLDDYPLTFSDRSEVERRYKETHNA